MSTEYETRLASRVHAFKAKWPERFEAIEMDVIVDLAVPIQYRLRGLPEWVKPLIAEKVAEAIRVAMRWPSEREWRG